jgi:6,7-dimethyl-8-ribityllumazine synthase
MPKTYEGGLEPIKDGRYAIVVSLYNENITGKLLTSAVDTLIQHGVPDDRIVVAKVPGAWEVPLVAAKFAEQDSVVAIICLGAVIKGETTHDEHINRQVSESLGRISLVTKKPVAFGILTCNTMDQAINRAGGNLGNKGIECAEAVLRMASLMASI